MSDAILLCVLLYHTAILTGAGAFGYWLRGKRK